MSERDDFCICLDCKHQGGIWINGRELDTFCTIDKEPNKSNECDYFEGV